MPSLGEVVAALEGRYDPRWAEPWDAVGLVCGDPDTDVRRVHLAVDPVLAVAEEAITAGAQLLVTHHPLFLGGTTSVAATTAKGRVVHRLLAAGCGLFVAHTNADVADPGVSDALAGALGLRDLRPLRPGAAEPVDKVVTFVPAADVDRLLDALAVAGAGTIGHYDRCAFLVEGAGTFRAGAGTNPTVGRPGEVTRTPEVRVEMVAPRARRSAVVRALLDAHPYEEPAYDVIELAAPPGSRGLGRVGELAEPMTLSEFTAHVARSLPETAWGVRAAGDQRRPVRTVAVCGGSGGDLAVTAARAGADVLVTADLKHHATSETIEDHVVALVDAAHWATEWPWLEQVAAYLTTGDGERGTDTVEATVSRIVTDPWTVHAHQKEL
ncbi:MAG: Nif3-like dinuclear metal center hexameric protein [Frankiales bacterium]|nr:Nif3-like dinuclear metal center hexameric protein [Frankiales bacterium]